MLLVFSNDTLSRTGLQSSSTLILQEQYILFQLTSRLIFVFTFPFRFYLMLFDISLLFFFLVLEKQKCPQVIKWRRKLTETILSLIFFFPSFIVWFFLYSSFYFLELTQRQRSEGALDEIDLHLWRCGSDHRHQPSILLLLLLTFWLLQFDSSFVSLEPRLKNNAKK